MNEYLRQQIYNNLSLRETEDLLYIYYRKNTKEWDAETFEIIKQILVERLGTIPDEPVQEQVEEDQDDVEDEEQGGELDEAIREAELAIQKEPEGADGFYLRGLAHEDLGQLENALADYRAAIRLEPDFEQAWNNFFSVEKELEKKYLLSATRKHLAQALEFANRKETEKALKECELAKKDMPALATAYNTLGMVLEELELLAPALEAYLEALQLNPRFDEAWDNLEYVEDELSERFKTSAAKLHLDQARAYAEEDEPEKALEECELARPAMAGMALAWNYLGLIQQGVGQTEAAIAAYFEAARLDPNFFAARENLANARARLEEEEYHLPDSVNLDDLHAGEDGDGEGGGNGGESDYRDPVPGWVYLGEPAFLLAGWPGHRNRPGRSGLDPLDTDFEWGHMAGVLVNGNFRTHNPIYQLMMIFIGLIFTSPLILIMVIYLIGHQPSIGFLVQKAPFWMVGLALLINVVMSLFSNKPEDADKKGNEFF